MSREILKSSVDYGMYDYGWRQYMPDVGRWMQLDPLVEDTEDPYAYVYNNPIKLTDPDGRAPEDGTEDCCSNIKGFALSMMDNVTGGNLAQKYNDGSAAYNEGVRTGNTTSFIAGGLLMYTGGTDIGAGTTGLIASSAASSTGVGTIAGVPGAVVSGGLILSGTLKVGLGTSMVYHSSKNMQNDNSKNSSNSSSSSSSSPNKVQKSKTTTTVGKEGKYTKTTEVRPSKQSPGQSRAEYTRVKNKDGKVIKTYKDSYDRANKFQHRKPLTGGPEGRPAN
ncbi:RHS repeat-associated core domain-containing protein [Chryseobacterium sp. GP-SGM7]|uniref:RHS repeat-associated core domain-containing protein n=1 Tax=Chryseobacterium sp. GP-SGM7 TaxID=3411323 RepID=UPI003B952672